MRTRLLIVAFAALLAGACTSPAEPTEATDDDGTWRSALFPADWTPEHEVDGLFLHDVSYAGYRYGEPVPAAEGPVVDVRDHGADPSGQADSTAAIQQAIDSLDQGGIVWLPAGTYRIDDRLFVRASGVVLRGDGPTQSRLSFTRWEGMGDRAHLTIGGALSHGAHHPLAVDAPSRATRLSLADASGLAVGDDVAVGFVITPEFVADWGMADTWETFNGTWRPFFRRTITAIDGDDVELDVPIRTDLLLRDEASVRVETGHVRDVGLEHLAVSTRAPWDAAWTLDRSHAIVLHGVVDGWVRDVQSFEHEAHPDPDRGERHLLSGGIKVLDSKRVTVADTDLRHAQNRGEGGNGYLFEISRSNEILIRDSTAVAGRHNFIQNWDFGTSGCVFLRTVSRDGRAFTSKGGLNSTGYSEFHHSLAMANLIDDSVVDDGWQAVNRQHFSSGAGHSATETVFWNLRGSGTLRSFQAGPGYVIGTGPELEVITDLETVDLFHAPEGTAPEDWREGIGEADGLEPRSLYEAMRERRVRGE